MKEIEDSGVSEFCDIEDCTKPNKQEALISDQELKTNRNNLICSLLHELSQRTHNPREVRSVSKRKTCRPLVKISTSW